MNRQAMSLMDVIAPPGNRWLMELSRRKTDLPPGVKIVRFNDDDTDDPVAESDVVKAKGARRSPRCLTL